MTHFPAALLVAVALVCSTGIKAKAVTTKKFFHQKTIVSIFIEATPAAVWEVLTDASKFTEWNTTIVSLSGDIEKGEKIKLTSTLDSSRTFTLKIKEFDPTKKLVWADMMGKRVFLLEEKAGGTLFTMEEKIGGILYPLFSRMIPPMQESFERFAQDLKKVVEHQ